MKLLGMKCARSIGQRGLWVGVLLFGSGLLPVVLADVPAGAIAVDSGDEIGPGGRHQKTIEHDEIVDTTWVAVRYRDRDGTSQPFDASVPAKRVTYRLDRNGGIVVRWGDQGEQSGTYDWFADRQDVDNLHVKFDSATSPDHRTESSAAEVRYAVTYDGSARPRELRLTNRTTRETLELKDLP